MQRKLFASITAMAASFAWLAAPGAPADAATCQNGPAGDLNGDGVPEIVIGVPGAEGAKGAVTIVDGRTKRAERFTAASLGFQPNERRERFGTAVLVTDVTGDGCSELIVGAPNAAKGAGRVYVAQGTPSGLSNKPLATIDSPDRGAEFGTALSISFVNGDRKGLLIGGPGYDDGKATSAGAVYTVNVDTADGGIDKPYRYTQNSPGIEGVSESHDMFGLVLSGPFVGVPMEDVGSARDAGAFVRLAMHPEGSVAFGEAVTQNSKGVSNTAESGDRFGMSLFARHSYIAVGAPGEDDGRIVDAGAAHVFWTDNSAEPYVYQQEAWFVTQNSPGIPGVSEKGDAFGSSVALGEVTPGESRRNLWIGADGEDVGSVRDAGSVTRLDDGSGLPAATLTLGNGLPGKAKSGDALGAALGTVRDTGDRVYGADSLLIGVPGRDVDSVADSGWVICSAYGSTKLPESAGIKDRPVADEAVGTVFGAA